jgi:hypothetical protein
MARLMAWSVFAVVLLGHHSSAQTTRYVGNCKVSSGFFATITDAVNAAQTGDTIAVCPGSYNEQVKIQTPLTLEGLSTHNSSLIEIAPPSNALSTVTAVSKEQIVPTVWVTATTGSVNIKSIIALTNPCLSTIPCCPPVPGAAIYYQSGSSGTISHVQALGDPTSDCGVGILAENATANPLGVTIQNSVIRGEVNFLGSGIIATSQQAPGTIPVLGVTISGNIVDKVQTGIFLSDVGGTVSGNVITSGFFFGIWDAAPGVTVSSNTLTNYAPSVEDEGIRIAAAHSTVKNNKIIIPFNIGINFTCLSANVTGNTINADTGILNVPSTFTGTNAFFNTSVNKKGGC